MTRYKRETGEKFNYYPTSVQTPDQYIRRDLINENYHECLHLQWKKGTLTGFRVTHDLLTLSYYLNDFNYKHIRAFMVGKELGIIMYF